jgi:hypothetical protein
VEALDIIIKFQKYKLCKHAAFRQVYYDGGKEREPLRKLVNVQTLPEIMGQMLPAG